MQVRARSAARSGLILAALAALSACGVSAPLKPKAGQQLPVAPLGRETRPTADELVRARPQDAPQRSVELRQRSEQREDDPYDLPPEG